MIPPTNPVRATAAYQAFEIDEEKKEPFLRLPEPYTNIIITPPRLSDADVIPEIMNSPPVYLGLAATPYPYERRLAVEWLEMVKKGTDQAWAEVLKAKESGNLLDAEVVVFNGSPVRIIREVNPDGSQTFLGDIGIGRSKHLDVTDEDERKRLAAENVLRPVGDENIVWFSLDYLAPSHHSKGIMTAVIRCLLERWGIPWMNTRVLTAIAFEGNRASVRVFEKNGFVLEKFQSNLLELDEKKGGGRVGLYTLIRRI